MLSTIQVKVDGFEILEELYKDDLFFGGIWEECKSGPYNKFLLYDDFLFKSNRLCIPECSLRESIMMEAHGGRLGDHFGRDKTLALDGKIFLAKMERNIIM